MMFLCRKTYLYALFLFATVIPQNSVANPGEARIINASMKRIVCVEIAEQRDNYEAQADKIYRRLLADLDMSGDDSAVIAQLTLPIIMALKGRYPQHIDAYFTLANQYETLKQTALKRRCHLEFRHRLNSFLDYVSTRVS